MAKSPKRPPSQHDTWETVSKLALVLPGVEESTSYRTQAMKVGGKPLGRLKEHGETIAFPMAVRPVRLMPWHLTFQWLATRSRSPPNHALRGSGFQ
jgi:hypothetical protein